MSDISLVANVADTITTYSYRFRPDKILSRAGDFKTILSTHSLPVDHKNLFTSSITYVTPNDREKFKTHYPNNILLQTYLEACSLAVTRDSLADEIPDVIKQSHQHNISESLKKLKSLADDNNDANAQMALYNIYSKGACGQEINIDSALKYLKNAADQGHAQSQLQMFFVYSYGNLGQKLNEEIAFEYLRKAADQGVAEAQYHMYFFYLNGTETQDRNPVLALDNLKKSMNQGFQAAKLMYEKEYVLPKPAPITPPAIRAKAPAAIPPKTPVKKKAPPKKQAPVKKPTPVMTEPAPMPPQPVMYAPTPATLIVAQVLARDMLASFKTEVSTLKTENTELRNTVTSMQSIIEKLQADMRSLSQFVAERQSILPEPDAELPEAIELEQDDEIPTSLKRFHEAGSDHAPKRRKRLANQHR